MAAGVGKMRILSGSKKETAFIFSLKLSLKKGGKDDVRQVVLVSILSRFHSAISPTFRASEAFVYSCKEPLEGIQCPQISSSLGNIQCFL